MGIEKGKRRVIYIQKGSVLLMGEDYFLSFFLFFL